MRSQRDTNVVVSDSLSFWLHFFLNRCLFITRAIDQRYVRGFHVRNEIWQIYKNGFEESEIHEITKTKIEATCNSVVTKEGNQVKIRVIGYDEKGLETLDLSEDC